MSENLGVVTRRRAAKGTSYSETPSPRHHVAITPKRSLTDAFQAAQDQQPPSDDCQVASSDWSSLSPLKKACRPSTTDRVLTFLQSARARDVPVRFGKWSTAEDAYLRALVRLFHGGLLADMPPKTSMRAWLARMLVCCPMRISKKQLHGENFAGKAKFRRNAARSEQLTQTQYDALCEEVERLRAAFLAAWAKDEFGRRRNRSKSTSFDDWYRAVVALVPIPVIATNAHIVECSKRPQPDTPTTLRREIHEDCKRRRVAVSEVKVEYQPEPDQVTLEPSDVTALACTQSAAMVVHPYFREAPGMGDWLMSPTQGVARAPWGETSSSSYVNDARFTLCEDAVQMAVHMGDQQHPSAGLSMTRRSSHLLIDFGAPSSWHAGEEGKDAPSPDCSQWSDHDLMDDLALLTEPGMLAWDDIPPFAHATCSPMLGL
ncbi:hypothetical protein BBJ28_00024525 [Nothophytophthora sp. Chile5]|nr:hypothetical protein BBJ28_00024525 [Nothophytophthora sp. Chile5]